MMKTILIFILLFFSAMGISSSIHSLSIWFNEPKAVSNEFLIISIDENTNNLEQIIRYYGKHNCSKKIIVLGEKSDEINKRLFDVISCDYPAIYYCSSLDEVDRLMKAA